MKYKDFEMNHTRCVQSAFCAPVSTRPRQTREEEVSSPMLILQLTKHRSVVDRYRSEPDLENNRTDLSPWLQI